MDTPQDRVKVVQAESERLKHYLHSLPPEAWSQPSACDRWEVRDVVAHLIGSAQGYTEFISRGLQGDASPPEGAPPDPLNAASNAETIAQRAISRRESLGDQLLPTFNATNDQLNQLLASLNPPDWDKPCYHRYAGLFSVRTFVSLRMMELAVHGWDIRSRLEPEAHLSGESLPVLMDLIPWLVSKWGFRPGPRLPASIRYRFALTGTGASNSDIVVEGDKASMGPAGTGKADVTFHCDTETFVLLIFGRLPLPDALAQSRLVAAGETELVHAFAQWFGGA